MTRLVKIDTPLGPEALIFRKMVAREELGRLFEYEVDLLGPDHDIALNQVVGQRMTVHLDLPDSSTRYFNGVVARFALVGELGRLAHYRATLRPWLWLLTHRATCRIFQGKSVPDIITAIFREHGLTDFDDALTANYPVCEYRVQYRETDFDFVSRLMEQSGIYYFFKHEAGKHSLVLADAYSAHSAQSGYEQVPYYPKVESGSREPRRLRDHLDTWTLAGEFKAGAFVADDFDFTMPKAELRSKLVSQHPLAKAALEIYDYPGSYTSTSDGQSLVKVRLEEIYARQEEIQAEGNARGMAAGGLFTLQDFARSDQNREYLIVSASCELVSDEYESVDKPSTTIPEPKFRCAISAIPSETPFRSRCLTPKPVVHGPQTAVVVGKSGEEIWTDAYGRVKLQFHWDRESKSDEASSCWVRVGQLWAGTKWGGIHIPRIGQEVIVEFLEGDPDRPLVTGRVYNADNMPPYALPDNQTQSGIKSRSTKGGAEANFNEIRFEDKKGSEQIFVQAEKDHETLVKNDQTLTVKHDRKKDVTNDETTTVGNNRTETVTKDETITINGNRTEKVAKEEKITIDGGRTETVAKDESITINGARTEKVAKDESITISGNRTEKVSGDESITISGKRTEKVAKDESVTVDGKRTVKIAMADKLEVQKLSVTAQAGIELKVGAGSITISPAGEIEIKGLNVKIEGTANVDVKANAIATVSGSMVKVG